MPELDAISDLQLDRFLAGELTGAEREQLAARLATDTALRARLDALETARRAFALEAPSFAGLLERASPSPSAPSWWAWLTGRVAWQGGVAATVAAAAVVTVMVMTVGPSDAPGGDVIVDAAASRTKGTRFLSVALKRDGIILRAALTSTSTPVLHPDDLVQFSIDAGDADDDGDDGDGDDGDDGAGAHVAVLSRDAAGTISVYAPTTGALERAHGHHTFGNSTRLDDVMGDEDFIGVRCRRDVPMTLLVERVRQGRSAPEGCEFDVVAVRKEPAPTVTP